jgi:multiple sugar transport system substrate-binding protein
MEKQVEKIMKANILKASLLGVAMTAFLAAGGQAADRVNFWYHFDNPENVKYMGELVASFEAKNPDIKVNAENIPWNSYYDKLFTSIAGGSAPDVAMVKLSSKPQLVEMGALEPINKWLEKWPAKADLAPNLLAINNAEGDKAYYLPLQYVAIYLYYRADLFKAAGLNPPETCEDFLKAAQALTIPAAKNNGVDQYGFGMRGGKGGYDNWGPFVLSQATFAKGGLKSAKAIAANQWYVDLLTKHKVAPPSAPNDGFNEIISTFKSGRTAIIFHHIGSWKTITDALGDKVSAVAVPSCGGGRWTSFGDESTAMFSASKAKDAAWKWMAFLSEGDNNLKFVQATGQMTVSVSASAKAELPARLVKATTDSLPHAKPLPAVPETAEFVNSVWPINMQLALTGQSTPAKMMEVFDQHFYGK